MEEEVEMGAGAVVFLTLSLDDVVDKGTEGVVVVLVVVVVVVEAAAVVVLAVEEEEVVVVVAAVELT